MTRSDQDSEVHEATNAFLRDAPAHRNDEDLHPTRLDPAAADLESALSRDALRKKEAQRQRDDG